MSRYVHVVEMLVTVIFAFRWKRLVNVKINVLDIQQFLGLRRSLEFSKLIINDRSNCKLLPSDSNQHNLGTLSIPGLNQIFTLIVRS